MTALAEFSDWIRDEVAPLLKERGFVRSRLTFRAPLGSNIALIHLQKSVKSSASEVLFTATVGVWSRRIASFHDGSTDVTPSIEDCHWTRRLGALISPGDDHWWVLHTRRGDGASLATFRDALLQHGIPAIQMMASDESLRDGWLAGSGPGLTAIQMLTYLSILLKAIGPASALPVVLDQLNERSMGKPVRAGVQAHLVRLATFAGNADAAS